MGIGQEGAVHRDEVDMTVGHGAGSGLRIGDFLGLDHRDRDLGPDRARQVKVGSRAEGHVGDDHRTETEVARPAATTLM